MKLSELKFKVDAAFLAIGDMDVALFDDEFVGYVPAVDCAVCTDVDEYDDEKLRPPFFGIT